MKRLIAGLVLTAAVLVAQGPPVPNFWKRTGPTTIAPRRATDNVAIGTTVPGGAPANSLAVGGKLYGDASGLTNAPAAANGSVCTLASGAGFKFDGSDETATLKTLLASWFDTGTGGCLSVDAGKTIRLDGQITLPPSATFASPPGSPAVGLTRLFTDASADGACSGGGTGTAQCKWSGAAWVSATPFVMPNFRFTGAGESGQMANLSGVFGVGSTLDMRYSSGPKFITLGAGTVTIDNLSLVDGGTDCAAFVQTTLSPLKIHDVAFIGTKTLTNACNDAVVLGGGDQNTLVGAVSDKFQGYGTVIRDNFFEKTSRAVYGRATANGVVVEANLISHFSGGAVAIEFSGAAADATAGVQINRNVIELTGYANGCGIKLSNTHWTTMIGNNFWDALDPVYAFCGDATSTANTIVGNPICIGGCTTFNPTWADASNTQIMADKGNLFPTSIGLNLGDTNLFHGSARELAIKNTAGSSSLTVYGSTDGTNGAAGTNYSRLKIDGNYAGGSPGVYSQGGGTGANPNLWLASAGKYIYFGGNTFYAKTDTGDMVTFGTLQGRHSGAWANGTEGGCGAYTDFVVDGTSNKKITSASYTFVAADVGGTIIVTGGTGWTTGTYNILSVSSGAATLDVSPAAVTTTGGQGSVNRGRIVRVDGAAGAADTFRICKKDAANSYAWTALY